MRQTQLSYCISINVTCDDGWRQKQKINNAVFSLLCTVYTNADTHIHKPLSPWGTIGYLLRRWLWLRYSKTSPPPSFGARRLITTTIMPIWFVKPRIVANVSEQYSVSILSGKLSLTLKIKTLFLWNLGNHQTRLHSVISNTTASLLRNCLRLLWKANPLDVM